MPIAAAVVKILIFGDETIDFDGKDPAEPIYIYQHIDNLTGHHDGEFYDLEGSLDCSLNYLSVRAYPDSYFTLLDVMDVDYIPPEVPTIGVDINNMCYPAYGVVETESEELAIASELINRETDILNGVISSAMEMANSSNAPRKITSSDVVYGVATKAKLIISNATNTFNQNTSAAKAQLNAGILAQAANPTVTVEFKPLDPELQMVYAKAIRFLENGIGKGKVPRVEKNVATGQRGQANGTQINDNLWINYAYLDNKGNPTLGFGHLLSIYDKSFALSPKNPYILTGKVTNPIRGFWPKSSPTFNTPAKLKDEDGISDYAVEALFIEDLAATVTQVQQLIGVERWNYLVDNDQCMLIVLIDLQFNTGNLANFKTLLSGNGLVTGLGSGLGLQIGKKFSHLIFNGTYSLDLWTKPSYQSGTKIKYIIDKTAELMDYAHRKESQVGSQRNNAIAQLFIEKDRTKLYDWYDKKRRITIKVNYWTMCNPDNIDLTKYMKYN